MSTISETTREIPGTVGEGVCRTGRNVLLVGMGAIATVDEQTRRTLDHLLHKGEEFRTSDRNVVGQAARRARTLAERIGRVTERTLSNTVEVLMHRVGVPTGDEIHEMSERAEQLNHRVETLRARTGGVRA